MHPSRIHTFAVQPVLLLSKSLEALPPERFRCLRCNLAHILTISQCYVLPGIQILSHRLAEQFHHVSGLLGWLELTNFACGTRWVWGGLNVGFGGLAPASPSLSTPLRNVIIIKLHIARLLHRIHTLYRKLCVDIVIIKSDYL